MAYSSFLSPSFKRTAIFSVHHGTISHFPLWVKLSRIYTLIRIPPPEGDKVVLLYGDLHSQRADDFQSENKQILGAIDLVREVIGKKGIWTLDRGSEARNYLPWGRVKISVDFSESA